MSASLLLTNLGTYCVQIGLLIALAACSAFLLGLRIPAARLAFFQLTLAACLLSPVLRPWKQQVVSGSVTFSTGTATIADPQHASARLHVSGPTAALLFLALGVLARLIFLAAGLWKLRRYRLHSLPLPAASSWNAEADLRISHDVSSPVTFGYRRPVILLPARFPEFGQSLRDAILCHEVLHVRRRDWLLTVAEEIVRAVFWFHPAIWWVLSEIQLAREQTVDRQVVEIMKSRDEYVDALLAIAGAPVRLDLAPAPLLLRKRHLKQRVVSILKEIRMSRARSRSTLAASFTMLAASCWFVTGVLPLLASPQAVADSEGVAVETGGMELLHRSPVAYPGDAVAKGIQGTVVATVKIDASGNVSDAVIVNGPDELRKPVLQSVLSWHFMKSAALSSRNVTVTFTAPQIPGAQTPGTSVAGAFGVSVPKMTAEPTNRNPQSAIEQEPPPTVRNIVINGLSDEARAALLAELPVREGDTLAQGSYAKIAETVAAFDEHLTTRYNLSSPTEVTVLIGYLPATAPQYTFTSAPRIRVGANVQELNLIRKVTPVYPPAAKTARVQGEVKFEIWIAKDGSVEEIHLLSGHPLLVQSAMEAVRQWVYKPTLLNGAPVNVLTMVNVNFTLLP